MRLIAIILFVLFKNMLVAQNSTDVSLFYKNDSNHYVDEVSSTSGDLFSTLGHHGPAVENMWIGLRLYFNKRASIDVYSKTKPGLELKGARWYPTESQQKKGWGADYYKVGETVGLGGIRLWDGEKVVPLDPVSLRYARVVRESTESYMEMVSENVPYKKGFVDIMVRVTVFSNLRNAKVEAFALTSNDVQFVTGINYHKNQKVIVDENFILTWGYHPEDVAAENIELGAAIIFNKDNFIKKIDDGEQYLLVSKPTTLLRYWITSANTKEPVINNFNKFLDYVSN